MPNATVKKRRNLSQSKQAQYNRRKRLERSEIGDLPKVENPRRKRACRLNAFRFVTEYFPDTTGLSPLSDDHRRIIADIQELALHGGRRINACYRGFAKTTLAENLTIWATIYGHRRFGLIVGVNKSASSDNMASIRAELAENDLLYGDFPEVCHPIRALEGRPQGAATQTYHGQPTRIIWRSDKIVLPTMPKSPASGCVIQARPYNKARGAKHKTGGANVRPDWLIVDDPQDEESASSPSQVAKNLRELRKGLLRTASHDRGLAVIVNATPIAQRDMVEQLLADPAWQGQRVPFVLAFPAAHKSFWLERYADVRRSFDRTSPDDKRRAESDATELYRSHRDEADAGAVLSWPSRFSPIEGEISALQHYYNVLIDDGEEAAASELQVKPLDLTAFAGGTRRLNPAELAAKLNNSLPGTVPQFATHLTASIDVHDRLLYWAVAGVVDGMRGCLVAWGTWPRQPVRYFMTSSCPLPLAEAYPGMLQDAYLWRGLSECTAWLLGTPFTRQDGAPMRVAKLLIDAHWGEKTELVKTFCRQHPAYNAVVLPSFGVSVKPGDILRVGRKEGGRFGPGWGIPPAERGMLHVSFDSDQQKSFVADRLGAHRGTPGEWEIAGNEPGNCALLFDHLASERGIDTSRGDAHKEHWELVDVGLENHWWDCAVLCFLGGLLCGLSTEETRSRPRRDPMSRPSLADLARGVR